MPHDRVPPGHALDADREDCGYHSRQSFGYSGNRQCDAKNQDIDDAAQAGDVFDQDDGDDHDDRDHDHDQSEDLPRPIELALKF